MGTGGYYSDRGSELVDSLPQRLVLTLNPRNNFACRVAVDRGNAERNARRFSVALSVIRRKQVFCAGSEGDEDFGSISRLATPRAETLIS